MIKNNGVNIGKNRIGDKQPVYVIAELSANHNQSFDIAVKTIEAAKKTGADAVKVQTYTADTITIESKNDEFLIHDGPWKGYSLYKLYQEAYTPWDWQPKLKDIANKLGLDLFSSPFDFSAVDFLEKMKVPAYKIASFEIQDIPLIKYAASKNKPMIISTGIADKEDIRLAVETCKSVGNNQIILLHCVSQYPAEYSEMNLSMIPQLKADFDVIVGLSDHSMTSLAAVASVALGAKVVEKHLILDRNMGGPDSGFSIEPDEFAEMVKQIRNTEKALGEVSYKKSKKKQKSSQHGRSLYVVKDIKKGEKFTPDNIRSIRPANGLAPKYYEEVLNKKAAQDLSRGHPLSKLDIGE